MGKRGPRLTNAIFNTTHGLRVTHSDPQIKIMPHMKDQVTHCVISVTWQTLNTAHNIATLGRLG